MPTKLLITLGVIFALSYPFISFKGKLRWLALPSLLRYRSPKNKRNICFVLLTIAEFVLVTWLFGIFEGFAKFVSNIPFLGNLFSGAVNSINSQIDYIIFAVQLVVINLLILYTYLIAKIIVRFLIIDPGCFLGGIKKRRQERKKKRAAKKAEKRAKKGKKQLKSSTPEDGKTAEELETERKRKRRRIPDFLHRVTEEDENEKDENGESTEADEEEEPKFNPGKIKKFIYGLFFEGEKFEFVRPWVVRTRTILQLFIRLIQIVYLLFVVLIIASVFWDLPMGVYNFLIDFIKIRNWYIYPVISMLFLQEICNVFNAPMKEEKSSEQKREEEEKKEDEKRDAKVRALLAELKKRFDAEHCLRCYPEVESEKVPEYICTNVMYASALNYIRAQMKKQSGRVVQSYMEFLDAIYNDSNVYFSASFYSELGEYLIAYTYIRLLSGARQIFIVSNADEKETLRRYISDRLMRMTGSSAGAGWRVYTADERLDQADVLIASPEDFLNNDIVDQYPSFFEEVCNAIVIDADKTIAVSSYMCPIIATKLQNSTSGRIRFIFLSLDLLKGFAAGSLPRFFCIDKVLSFSSAKENEAVSYVLWNKESKKHRIYNKSGQKRTCLETIIAEQAFNYGIDGVRLITEAPLEHAERKILSMHDVEINNLYKNIVDINYMIYSDDRCNLSAALYACTRFRGRKKSVVHILSKPYLLREYFMSKAILEDFINRSSFIQPRVTEHAERYKLSLVRIFCDATYDKGITVTEFEKRMRDVIIATKERGDIISSAYCRNIIDNRDVTTLKLFELAAFLVAGLYDNDPQKIAELKEREIAEAAMDSNVVPKDPSELEKKFNDYCISTSVGNRAKDFYIVVEPSIHEGYVAKKEKYIVFNRVKEVFNHLLECNKRVELRLNDRTIGLLDTFPSRVHLEYTEGQTIIFDNSEYEIEHIPLDGSAIYLRHENISIKNCLDTVLLRRYDIKELIPMENSSAVLNNSKSMLEEIRVTKCKALFNATTYGFYSLTSDKQTLDFYHGVEGNPRLDRPNVRSYANSRVLNVSLKVRRECNDGMRLLLAAVFNEFIKTIFPDAYRCVAICPILENPLTLESENIDEPIERIKTLYPFVESPTEEYIETDKNIMRFLFINDCEEDIGVLDWFYDRSGRYMQEFLANIYSYLHWLKILPEKNHFIYFGGTALPECYDLEGCCEILSDFNLILSDDGKKDIETAGDDSLEDHVEYCAFCHKPAESGRYEFFDKHRFICSDCCVEVVSDDDTLEDIYANVRRYLTKHYPEITHGKSFVKFDELYDLTEEQTLSEYYSRLDFNDKTIYVEGDEPKNNIAVSILRGIISFWQVAHSLSNSYSSAQLYYEEILYLRSIGENSTADWVYNNVPDYVREGIDEITAYVEHKDDFDDDDDKTNTNETVEDEKDTEAEDKSDDSDESEEKEHDEEETTPNAPPMDAEPDDEESEDSDSEDEADESDDDGNEDKKDDKSDKSDDKKPTFEDNGRRTSFSFMRMKAEEDSDKKFDDPKDDDYSDGLYNPNLIPRFWKRLLRDQEIDDGKAEDIPEDAKNFDDDEEDADDKDNKSSNNNGSEIEDNDSENNDDTEEPIEDEADEDEDMSYDIDEEDLEPNAPPADEVPQPLTDDSDSHDNGKPVSDDAQQSKEDKKAEKLRKKEEKKRLKEEKKKQKLAAWEQKLNAINEDKKKKAAKFGGASVEDDNKDDKSDNPEKKKGFSLFGRKKDKDTEDENKKKPVSDDTDNKPLDEEPQNTDDIPTGTEDKNQDKEDIVDNSEKKGKSEKKDKKGKSDKKDKTGNKDKKAKKSKKSNKNLSKGERICPYEKDEKTNPKIRLYNSIVRAAYNYSEDPISREGVKDSELANIINYVRHDYPELFWLTSSYSYTNREIFIKYRCRDANGRLDIKQIEKKCKELRNGAKYFTKGIDKKTDPYKALLTIYRRVILEFDYDGVGLNARADLDQSKDDSLRSLYNAIVKRKVVCAGYAVAMQYLLQSVGIVCGYVVSEDTPDGGCHAFNILKIGKYCYYLDATWGDFSNTLHGDHKNDVEYGYFCVPYEEFLRTGLNPKQDHVPRNEYYPKFNKQFNYTNHEYYRYHKAYLTSYNESEIIRIIAETAMRHDEDSMGNFSVGFRCSTPGVAAHIYDMLYAKGKVFELVDAAKDIVAKKKKKKAVKLLERTLKYLSPDIKGHPKSNIGVIKLIFEEPKKKDKKKDKKQK